MLRLPTYILCLSRECQLSSVVTHIARKTSEIWGPPLDSWHYEIFRPRVLTQDAIVPSLSQERHRAWSRTQAEC
jgi:hypothetical protein